MHPPSAESSEQPSLADLLDPEILRAELVKDPLRFCFTRGVAAITPDAHGATLQGLLMDIYERTPTCPQTDPSRHPLRRYIYCFCYKKIRRRLQSGILGHNGRFLELFLQSKKHGNITREDFQLRKQVQLEFPERKGTNEHWLYRVLAGMYPEENFGPMPKSGQPYNLHLGEDQLWKLWEFFMSCLEDLDTGLAWLDLNTRGNNAGSYAVVEAVLDAITNRMKILSDFVHTSPTFWGLVVGISDVLKERMVNKLMTEDVAHESDYESPAHSDGEDSENDTESEKGCGPVKLSGIALKVRLWLRRVTKWYLVNCDLSQGHLALGMLNRRLSIHVDIATKAVQPSRQASLGAIVESLEGPGDANDRLEWILTRARDLYQNRVPPDFTAADVLINASVDSVASLERWETIFPSASVHCEARLACTMHQKQARNVPIGASKRCCYCCALLLTELGFNKDDVSRHGKIYIWSPPSGLSHEIKEYILRKLKKRLEHYLRDYVEGCREADYVDGKDREVLLPFDLVLGVDD